MSLTLESSVFRLRDSVRRGPAALIKPITLIKNEAADGQSCL
jgi:hypothetical protein